MFLTTDASLTGIGAWIGQENDKWRDDSSDMCL